MESVSTSSFDNASSNQSNITDKNKHSTQVKSVTSASHTANNSGMSTSWISFIISCIIMLIVLSIIGYYFYSNPAVSQELKSNIKNMVQKLPRKV